MAFNLTLQSIQHNTGTLTVNVQYNDDSSGYAAQKAYVFDNPKDFNIQDIKAHIMRDANLIKQANNTTNALQNAVGTVITI